MQPRYQYVSVDIVGIALSMLSWCTMKFCSLAIDTFQSILLVLVFRCHRGLAYTFVDPAQRVYIRPRKFHGQKTKCQWFTNVLLLLYYSYCTSKIGRDMLKRATYESRPMVGLTRGRGVKYGPVLGHTSSRSSTWTLPYCSSGAGPYYTLDFTPVAWSRPQLETPPPPTTRTTLLYGYCTFHGWFTLS